jgi:Protein of unknown function (DUF2905)
LPVAPLGKMLIVIGLLIAASGAIIWRFGSLPYLGRLPGDIYVRGEHGSFYFPLATCILLSIALTLLFALLGRR